MRKLRVIAAAWAVSLAILGLVAARSFAQEGAGLGGDPALGEKVFKKCAACHSLEPGKKKVGPSLYGVIGRTPGTLEGFKYSKGLTELGASGAMWDEAALDTFLTKPRDYVKGTRMSFPGLKKPEDRANVIAYLKQAAEEN